MHKLQLDQLITATLRNAGMYSTNAVALLMETAAVESSLGKFIFQIGGPARGIFQMEPASEKDVWDNYVTFKEPLRKQLALYGYRGHDPEKLVYDLRYQILMARIHYLRVAEAIPGSTAERARYWKQHYNTKLGKGTVGKYILAANIHLDYYC
jgi:hypothetical protein